MEKTNLEEANKELREVNAELGWKVRQLRGHIKVRDKVITDLKKHVDTLFYHRIPQKITKPEFVIDIPKIKQGGRND